MAQEIDIRVTAGTDAGAIWELLGDSRRWPSWTPIEAAEVNSPGRADGLHEIRTFKTGRVTVREEIVERIPEKRLSYRLLSGIAVNNYRADVDLAPAAHGTEIRWHTTFDARVPGTGWLYRRALSKATKEFVDGLARHSANFKLSQ